MKQDKELIKKILLLLVESERSRMNISEVHRLSGSTDESSSATRYHLSLLEDDGYIVYEGDGAVAGYRVTAQGQARYEWYESTRDPFATA